MNAALRRASQINLDETPAILEASSAVTKARGHMKNASGMSYLSLLSLVTTAHTGVTPSLRALLQGTLCLRMCVERTKCHLPQERMGR